MHNDTIAIALADARVADLRSAATHHTASAPPRRHLRALAPLALAATAALAALAPAGTLARSLHDTTTPAQDLRSADARDAARTAQLRQDLRSADARDAADGRGTYNSPDVVVVKVPKPVAAPVSASPSGLDWADAGIGAGGLLGLSLIGFGGALVVVHRRRESGSNHDGAAGGERELVA